MEDIPFQNLYQRDKGAFAFHDNPAIASAFAASQTTRAGRRAGLCLNRSVSLTEGRKHVA